MRFGCAWGNREGGGVGLGGKIDELKPVYMVLWDDMA